MKILIVDDAEYIVKAFKDMLELYGFEVENARDGEKALAKYKKLNPNLVIMDILMPKLDGISATKKILEYDPEAKIIIVTAVSKFGLEEECINVGAKAFIRKPFKIKELLSIIEKTLGDQVGK